MMLYFLLVFLHVKEAQYTHTRSDFPMNSYQLEGKHTMTHNMLKNVNTDEHELQEAMF